MSHIVISNTVYLITLLVHVIPEALMLSYITSEPQYLLGRGPV